MFIVGETWVLVLVLLVKIHSLCTFIAIVIPKNYIGYYLISLNTQVKRQHTYKMIQALNLNIQLYSNNISVYHNSTLHILLLQTQNAGQTFPSLQTKRCLICFTSFRKTSYIFAEKQVTKVYKSVALQKSSYNKQNTN